MLSQNQTLRPQRYKSWEETRGPLDSNSVFLRTYFTQHCQHESWQKVWGRCPFWLSLGLGRGCRSTPHRCGYGQFRSLNGKSREPNPSRLPSRGPVNNVSIWTRTCFTRNCRTESQLVRWEYYGKLGLLHQAEQVTKAGHVCHVSHDRSLATWYRTAFISRETKPVTMATGIGTMATSSLPTAILKTRSRYPPAGGWSL